MRDLGPGQSDRLDLPEYAPFTSAIFHLVRAKYCNATDVAITLIETVPWRMERRGLPESPQPDPRRKSLMPLISHAARCFDEVARRGSIRKAAEKLNASASAINRQILKLEDEYGVALFERLPRGVRLTAAGEVLINDVRRWLRDQRRAQQHLDELRGMRRGHASIGLMECLATDFVPYVISAIQADHPGITIDALAGSTEAIAAALANGTIDVAIGFSMPHKTGIRSVYSLDVPIGAVFSSGHPLARASLIRLLDCTEFPWVLPDKSMIVRSYIDEAFATVAVQIEPAIASNSIALIKAKLHDDRHISFLNQVDVYREVRDGALVFRTFANGPFRTRPLSVCVREHGPVTSAAHLVADMCRIELARLFH